MTILQLNPPIGVETVKGPGFANFLIDYGLESDLYWVVFQESGEIWTWSNKEVVLQKNITAGRTMECGCRITEESFTFVDKWPFGAYKGHMLADVPKVYPQYLCDSGQLELPELRNLKKTLLHLGLINERITSSST